MKKTTKSNNSPKAIIQAFTYGKLINAKLYEHPLCKKDRSLFYYRIQCSFMSGQKKIIQTAYVTREELLSQRSFYEKQIEEKNYDAELVKRGVKEENIHHYGFAFRGKEVLIDGR